jgi:hypothetical protein
MSTWPCIYPRVKSKSFHSRVSKLCQHLFQASRCQITQIPEQTLTYQLVKLDRLTIITIQTFVLINQFLKRDKEDHVC